LQINNTTLKNGIVQKVERLCKLGDGGITNDTTLFLQVIGDINLSYKKVIMAILRSDTNWKFDDSNYTDFPLATIDLVSNKRDYTLPASASGGNFSTLYRINRIRIKDSSANWHTLDQMEAEEEEVDTSGFPTKYRLLGGSLRFKELPTGITTTGGLEVTFQRAADEFTTADTTQQPGFMDSYHDLLAYDASATYLLPFNTQLAVSYMQIFDSRLKMLQADYSLASDGTTRRMTPAKSSNK